MKKIIITGATGLIGQQLTIKLTDMGYKITIFTRNPDNAQKKLPNVHKVVKWEYDYVDEWLHELESVDAVIHLAGANISTKRWNKEYKKLLYDSRIISTKKLIEAIKTVERKPKVFITASAIGYYGNRSDEILTEESEAGKDFLANLCNDWEKEAKNVEQFGVRSVQIRTGLALSRNEGALKQMLPVFKYFIGGPLGNGKQWYSWLHIEDIINVYIKVLESEILSGPINAVSPNPVTMKKFAKILGEVLHRPSLFSVPKIILLLVIGQVAEVVTSSQRVVPEKLLNSSFKFKFEKLEDALRDILK
ncbi:MAG: TIGR01777 family oxidoreductase [Ignavibacterium sp.]|nr:TIGR01777 family oxidoreductase [Ignavibacterium sp.]